VEELHRPAPPRPAVDPNDPNPFKRLALPTPPAPAARAGKSKTKQPVNTEPGFAAVVGAEITLAGGLRATIAEVGRGEARLDTATGSAVVSFGSAIRVGADSVRLVAPAERVAAGVAALKAWRTALAKKEGKPPYVYLSDAHITDIAERDPDTAARLARCKGIGPGKLESYGETILGLLEEA
jgi:superfamily II DNA helicase RecQ